METTAETGPSPLAGRREYLGLAVLGLLTFVMSLDMSVLFLAQPHLTEALGATATQQLWISDIYGFVVSGLLILMGALGDRIGRRRLMLMGAAAFAVISIIAAWAQTPIWLILARAALGVAGATLMPSTLTLLRSMFPDMKQYTKAMAFWVACFMGGFALGPVIGGALLQFFWWGSVFLPAVPVMVLVLVLGPRLLPEYKEENPGRLDLLSAVMSLLTVLPVVYGLKQLVYGGFSVVPVVSAIVGLIFGVLFVQRQRVLESPMLDLTLFHNRTFSVALTMTIFGGLMAGTNFFVYQYLQTVEGLEPLYAALWLLPSSLITVLSIQLTPIVAQRFRPGNTIACGMVLVAIGYLLLTRLDGSGGLGTLVTGLVISGIGVGPLAALGAGLAMGSVSMEKAGNGAAMNQIAGDFGLAAGVAVVGSIGTAVYRAFVVVPDGVPGAAVGSVRESVSAAYEAASKLSPDVASRVIANANDAFASALNIAAIVSAALAVTMLVMSSILLRHVPPTGQDQPPADAAPDAQPEDAEKESSGVG